MDRGVESALQRSGYGFVEESAEETARRRTSWFGEAGRRRIERQEDRVRRDPVYAEKIARRHAAFPLSWAVATASTPSSVSAAVVPEHCYFDPKPAAVAPTATSTSPVAASVVPTSAARDGNLAARPPTTCSTQCPSRAVTVAVPALAPIAAPASSRITVGVAPERYVLNLKPTAVTSTTTSTSPVGASILTGCAARGGDLDLTVPSTCTKISMGDETNASSTPSFQLAVPSSYSSIPASPPSVFMRPAVGDLCSDMAIFHVPQALDRIPVTTSPDHSDDTPRDDQSLELSVIGSSKCSEAETALGANSMTSLILDNIQHNSVFSVESDSASLNAQLVAPVKVLSVSSSSINSVGREEELRPLPWPSFLCYHGGRPPLLPKNQVLCVAGTLDVRDEWPISVERKPWPPPPIIHGSVPAHQKMKEQNMSPPLPHLASATVSWDTSMHQLKAQVNHSSGSCDHQQKPGYASNLLYMPGLIQLSCSSENVTGECICEDICVQLLLYQFNCVGPFCQQYMECLPLCAPAYPGKCAKQVPFQDFLLESFCGARSNFHLLYPGVLNSLSLAASPVPCHSAQVIAGMGFSDGSVSQPCEFARSSLFDMLRAITIEPALTAITPDVTSLSTSAVCNVQAFAWNIVQYFSMLCRDSMCYFHLQPWPSIVLAKFSGCLITEVQHVLCPTRSQAHIPVSRSDDDSFSYGLVLGQECIKVQRTKDALHLQQAKITFLQARTGSRFIGYSSLIGCKLMHWKIEWPLYFMCSTSGNKSGKLFHPTNVRYEGDLEKRNASLQPCFTRTVQVLLLVNWSQSHRRPYTFLAYVAIWIFHSMEFCPEKLSWDPGIWALLCFFGIFTQAEATGRRNAAAPAYYCVLCLDNAYYFDKVCADQDYYMDVFCDKVHIGHDYNLDVFLEQVCVICYLNLVKICFDYGTCCDLGEVMADHVPWDPGGSTWHWLEVKLKFKEGGMLASYPTATNGLGLGCYYWAWTAGKTGGNAYKYPRKQYEQAGLELDGFGLLCFGFFFLCIPLLLFLLSLVFLLSPVMARS